jgi:hypothetical protein
MTLSIAAYFSYFLVSRGTVTAAWFLVLTAPAAIYFFRWFMLAWTNGEKADHGHSMRLCIIASTGLNVFGPWGFISAKRIIIWKEDYEGTGSV